MENQEVASLLDSIADILEIQGADVFRIRSYRKGAEAVASLGESIDAVVDQKRLREIPGIGKSLAEKMEEIVATGDCQLHRDLQKQMPPELTELLGIPGVGPKSVKLLATSLHVKNVDDLEKAAKAGKVASLPGMGAKTQELMLKGIEQYRRHQGRFRLDEALPYARNIVDRLRKLKGVAQIAIAGSLRRHRETVGDVDILVAGKNLAKAMDVFTSLDEVTRVLAKGHTKSSVVLRSGIQADLRVVDTASFGAALHYFTGSKAHNIAIRELGHQRGLKINEYGVFRVKDEARVGGADEEDVFASVDLPFIEPELREDAGEIDAARSGKLPKLIERRHIKGDLQMHTTLTDGKNSIEEMVEACIIARRYKFMALTDHSKAVRVAGGVDEAGLRKQLAKIKKVRPKYPKITILTGIEVDIMSDSTLDLSDDVLAECDVVIAAVHSKFNMTKEDMTARITKGMRNRNVNILAHPTGRLINEREPYLVDVDELIRVAVDCQVALELNAAPQRLDLSDVCCRAAKKAGARITINTDAHNTVSLDNMDYGLSTARRGWLEPKDVINTFPVSKLKKFLGKR